MRAIALLSGGLDSTLAARLMQDLGIELLALNFKTPFCLCDRKTTSGCINQSRKAAEVLGIEYKTVSISEDFLKIIPRPKHGYGAHMNPCIDCRILKFRKAKEFMREAGASFIITGEVLGQRPMSQHRRALDIIDRESELEGLVLRPLSAKLLPESIPEKSGWVKREKLLAFNGRSRKPQIELAGNFGIRDYPCPAGGCLLTDAGFSKRIKDLMSHGKLTLNEVELLKIGRHFRLSPETKLVVGRDEKENSRLLDLAQDNDYLFIPPDDIAGPTALGRGVFNDELMKLSGRIACRYCDRNGKDSIGIVYKRINAQGTAPFGDSPLTLEVLPVEKEKLTALHI